VIENCAIATMDGPRHDQGGTEYRSGHVTVTGDRITAVGEGPASSVPDGGELRTVDAATAAREVRAARLRLVGPEPS
jgi:hypothetical protein